jgi:hypothetical protein
LAQDCEAYGTTTSPVSIVNRKSFSAAYAAKTFSTSPTATALRGKGYGRSSSTVFSDAERERRGRKETMNKGIEITRRENHHSKVVRVWMSTHDLARSLKKRTGRPMIEIFHLALEQVRVIGQNGKAK